MQDFSAKREFLALHCLMRSRASADGANSKRDSSGVSILSCTRSTVSANYFGRRWLSDNYIDGLIRAILAPDAARDAASKRIGSSSIHVRHSCWRGLRYL